MEEVQEGDTEVESETFPVLKVGSVDYCLLCGQIAVMYGLDGNIIKREVMQMDGLTYIELFDYLCHSLKIKKKSRAKKDWHFESDPFPFCVPCEEMMLSLAKIYRQKEELHNTIISKMHTAEDTYIREELYEYIRDDRYLDFRKHALGDLFRGNESLKRRRASQRRDTKIESTCSSTDPAGRPAHTMFSSSKEVSHSTWADLQQDEKDLPVPIRRSLRTRNKDVKYLEEDHDEDLSCENKPSNLIATSPENFDTGAATNTVTDENTNGRRRCGRKRNRHSSMHGVRRNLNVENFNLKYTESVPPNVNSYYNGSDCDTRVSSAGNKRGRKRRKPSTMHIKQENDVEAHSKARIKTEVEAYGGTNKDNPGDLYKMTPWVKDPLSGNIYYRTQLFVWIKEENAFQCSTCSVFIPNNIDSTLKNKFYRHHINFHSDRFMCTHCPEGIMFQNDMELHQHFRHCHPGFQHNEPLISCSRSRVTNICHRPQILSLFSDPKTRKQGSLTCSICLKPLNGRDERGSEEHRRSHMNADEKATLLKSEELFHSVRKSRKRVSKIQSQHGLACIDDIKSHLNQEEKNAFLKASSARIILKWRQRRKHGHGPFGDSMGETRNNGSDHLSARHGECLTLKCPEEGCGAEFRARYSFHSHLRRIHGKFVRKGDFSPEKQPVAENYNPQAKNTIKEAIAEEVESG